MPTDETTFLKRLNSALPPDRRHRIPAPQPDATIDSLSTVSTGQYQRTVMEHLGQEHEPWWTLFTHPALINRTYGALLRKQRANMRLAAYAELPHDTCSDDIVRRRRSFLSMLEDRLQQVELLLPDSSFAPQTVAARSLLAAIRAHQLANSDSQTVPEAWDTRLWDRAEQIAATLDDVA